MHIKRQAAQLTEGVLQEINTRNDPNREIKSLAPKAKVSPTTKHNEVYPMLPTYKRVS